MCGSHVVSIAGEFCFHMETMSKAEHKKAARPEEAFRFHCSHMNCAVRGHAIEVMKEDDAQEVFKDRKKPPDFFEHLQADNQRTNRISPRSPLSQSSLGRWVPLHTPCEMSSSN